MDKLEKILRKYLNNGSNRIDVTMVLALIQQCKKDTKEQLILSGVSQQSELLAFKDWFNKLAEDSDDRLYLTDETISRFKANCG
jgi:hypothetical protein